MLGSGSAPYENVDIQAGTASLLFSNPHARVVDETPSRLIIDIPDVPRRLTSRHGSGTQVAVTFDKSVTAVEVSRSLYTSNEIYFVIGGTTSDLVVTDHFLTAFRRCPREQQMPDDDALLDHFLFRTVPGEGTYARGVVRLGHGRTVRWTRGSSRLQTVQQQRVESPDTISTHEVVQMLDEALSDFITSVTHVSGEAVANLLSGGVDSTLLQTFLPPATPSLSVAIDTPEFAGETERALAASKLTGSRHRVVSLSEQDYLGALERFVGKVGLPPHHMQSVLLGELFAAVGGGLTDLLTGQLADALFGLGSLARPGAALRRWHWVPMLTTSMRLPVLVKSHRLQAAEAWFSLMRRPVSSPRGLAARTACYTDFGFLEKVFGSTAIERRLSRRLEYILELCPWLSAAAMGPEPQLEAAHVVDFFCDDALSIWRQASMSYGRYLISPFTHPAVVRCALALNRRNRYWAAGETKPALKALLRKRLPTYDTSMPKLSFGLPLQRFLDSGPLYQSRYFRPPDFFPRGSATSCIDYPPWVAWGILTLSTWRALGDIDEGTPPVSLSRSFRW